MLKYTSFLKRFYSIGMDNIFNMISIISNTKVAALSKIQVNSMEQICIAIAFSTLTGYALPQVV